MEAAAERRREIADLTGDRDEGRRQLDEAERALDGLQGQVDELARSLEERVRGRQRRNIVARWALVVIGVLALAAIIMWRINVGVAAIFAFTALLWPVRRLSEALFPRADQSWWPSVIGSAVISVVLLLVQVAITVSA